MAAPIWSERSICTRDLVFVLVHFLPTRLSFFGARPFPCRVLSSIPAIVQNATSSAAAAATTTTTRTIHKENQNRVRCRTPFKLYSSGAQNHAEIVGCRSPTNDHAPLGTCMMRPASPRLVIFLPGVQSAKFLGSEIFNCHPDHGLCMIPAWGRQAPPRLAWLIMGRSA